MAGACCGVPAPRLAAEGAAAAGEGAPRCSRNRRSHRRGRHRVIAKRQCERDCAHTNRKDSLQPRESSPGIYQVWLPEAAAVVATGEEKAQREQSACEWAGLSCATDRAAGPMGCNLGRPERASFGLLRPRGTASRLARGLMQLTHALYRVSKLQCPGRWSDLAPPRPSCLPTPWEITARSSCHLFRKFATMLLGHL
jgi:hypothetical protein